jgi:hypothetical protein
MPKALANPDKAAITYPALTPPIQALLDAYTTACRREEELRAEVRLARKRRAQAHANLISALGGSREAW